MPVEDSEHGSVPLITLSRRDKYHRLDDDNDNDNDNLDFDTGYSGANYEPPPQIMARVPTMRDDRKSSKRSVLVIASSYVFDWITAFVILGVSYFMGHQQPNRRPFFLEDPNISFPYTEEETVPPWLLVTLSVGMPIIVILIISLIFVPGHTVPRGTPKSIVWKRKLWELNVGWLGMTLALAGAWFITNGMKNLFGKPRPDLLSRCNPDLANYAKYIVGGLDVADGYQRLVSAAICRGVEGRDLADGFRSYPSGHSSSAAAGLIYLSLFISSKFAITVPFLAPGAQGLSATATAFPSRGSSSRANTNASAAHDPSNTQLFAAHNARLASVRRQGAAPPIYLLIFAITPFAASVWIAASRWFNFRHHGFDILFGYLIGAATALLAFRWYHLPISQGAGWAWGPRCADKAWWAGVGSLSYALDWEDDVYEGAPAVAMEEGRAMNGFGRPSSEMEDREGRKRMQ